MRVFRVEQALKKLGRDIQDVRKRRRISTSLMAERIGSNDVLFCRRESHRLMKNGRAIIGNRLRMLIVV